MRLVSLRQTGLIRSICGCSGQRHRAQVQASQHKTEAGSEAGDLNTPRLATDQTSSCSTATVRPLPSPLAHLAAQAHRQQTPAAAADAAAAAAAAAVDDNDDDNDDDNADDADADDADDDDSGSRSKSHDNRPGTANCKF